MPPTGTQSTAHAAIAKVITTLQSAAGIEVTNPASFRQKLRQAQSDLAALLLEVGDGGNNPDAGSTAGGGGGTGTPNGN